MYPPIPSFRPLAWLRGGHLQTLAGFWLPSPREPYTACQHLVALPDGDRIVLHDDCPADWRSGGPTALLLHGICGSYQSSYLVRAVARLKERGVRTFRMDQRGCGAGWGLASRPFHPGISEDVAAALRAIARICPDAPTDLVGYSMGGNIALKLAGEDADALPANVRSVMAISPPIDLGATAARIESPWNRFYDRYFLRFLMQIVESLRTCWRRLRQQPLEIPRFRSMRDLNEFFLTRVWQFGSLGRFYRVCSSAQFLPAIQVPTLVITAADDPIVPVQAFEEARFSRRTRLVITERGGHVGFVGKALPADPDHRWIDWRVVDWVTHEHQPALAHFHPRLLVA